MSQLLDTPDKIYRPIKALPGIRRSSRERPHATLRDDAGVIVLGFWTLIALFWDGIIHNNEIGQDSFWSGAHIAMYLGLGGLGVWIGLVFARHQSSLSDLDFSAVPKGYGLAIVALPLAALAGPLDFMWHAAYGFENQIPSSYSPPHMGLFLSGALLAAIPLASAYRRPERAPSLKNLLPAVFSGTAVVGVMLFVAHQLVPFYAGVSTTQAFHDDLARFDDAYAGGTDAVHTEGLAQSIVHYGDDKFPFFFFSTHHTMGGILIFTGAVLGTMLYLRRRWILPMGSLTIMTTSLGLLFAMIAEYRDAELIPALVVAGIAADLLMARLAGDRPLRRWGIRVFATAVPFVLWGAFFLCVELFQGGLGWEVTLWLGAMLASAAVGFATSMLVFPPAAPLLADDPAPALDRAPTPPLA